MKLKLFIQYILQPVQANLGFIAERLLKIEQQQDKILANLNVIITMENQMAQELDDLTQEVSDTKSVEESAITLIKGLADQLAAAGTDPAKLQALHDSLQSSTNELAAAIAANTPADPTAPATGTGTTPTGAPTDPATGATETNTQVPGGGDNTTGTPGGDSLATGVNPGIINTTLPDGSDKAVVNPPDAAVKQDPAQPINEPAAPVSGVANPVGGTTP